MSKAITILAKTSYGRMCFYPQCDEGKLFAKLAGNKTLTSANLKIIEQLGYTIYLEQQTFAELSAGES